MSQKQYIVNVDALGYASGVAKKGETVTAQQIGDENISRLVTDGTITLVPENVPVADVVASTPAQTPDDTEPETPQARLALGLLPMEGIALSEAEIVWVKEVKEGVVPVVLNEQALDHVTKAEIAERIVALGGEAPEKSKNKTEFLMALQAQVEAYFAAWEVD